MHIFHISLRLCTLVVASFIAIGCSTITVNQDYDTNYDFSKLKSFGFLPITENSGIDQINANRIKDAILTNLSARGYTPSEQADFGIALYFSTKTKTSVQDYGYGYGYGHWGMRDVEVSQYDEGTLVIDFIDIAQKELVWRGSGTGVVSGNASTEERTTKINNAVTQILAQFPPDKEK
jgi:hypothetical protein